MVNSNITEIPVSGIMEFHHRHRSYPSSMARGTCDCSSPHKHVRPNAAPRVTSAVRPLHPQNTESKKSLRNLKNSRTMSTRIQDATFLKTLAKNLGFVTSKLSSQIKRSNRARRQSPLGFHRGKCRSHGLNLSGDSVRLCLGSRPIAEEQ